MPELPEIENLARHLRSTIAGNTIVDVHVGQPKAVNMPATEFQARARGRVEAVDRLGKSAIIHLPHGDLWIHLGLRGQVQVVSGEGWPAAKFMAFRFADGKQLTIDKTFMGHAYYVPSGTQPPGEQLGIDALDRDLTLERFQSLVETKPGQVVKAVLMNQALIAGIGNTYSDEILVRAGIHPARRIAALSKEEIGRLYQAMRKVLAEAIDRGGERGWSIGSREGRYENAVHGVERCGVCGGRVKAIEIGGRTGYYCAACQPEAAKSTGAAGA